jgi:DNA-binding beta-propeller fold protein YncE
MASAVAACALAVSATAAAADYVKVHDLGNTGASSPLTEPLGIAISPVTGNFYVVDGGYTGVSGYTGYGHDRVVEFTSDGGYVTQWSLGVRNWPLFDAVDTAGNVYISEQGDADRGNSAAQRILEYSSDGHFIGTTLHYTSQWAGCNVDVFPTGVAFDPAFKRIYTTRWWSPNPISCFAAPRPDYKIESAASGNFEQFGGAGSGDLQFKPLGVASSGRAVVGRRRARSCRATGHRSTRHRTPSMWRASGVPQL